MEQVEPAITVTWGTASAIAGVVALIVGAAVAYFRALLKSEITSMENTLLEKTQDRQDRFKIDIREIIQLNVGPLVERVERLEDDLNDR